ncbi:MAG TPA: beta-ketoacyl synthase N-terminal-like domain-containing protein, partial [Phycisphaerae bacterium]|nr:beta-ketoacyl synthase N-terminal-like domain-containing protein [Phycisphaerae bacterium]
FSALAGGGRFIRRVDDPLIAGGEAVCAGQLPDFTPPAGTEYRDRVCQLSVAAAEEAWAAAGLAEKSPPPPRVAVSFGTSKGGILAFARVLDHLQPVLHPSTGLLVPGYATAQNYLRSEVFASDCRHVRGIQNYPHPEVFSSRSLQLLLSDVPPDAPARALAARFGAAGDVHATVAACATGTLAVIRGVQMLLDGRADVVLAGSADASLHPLWFAAFRQIGVLAAEHPQRGPAWACRPFDATREGFAVSEGAAVLVLESARSVRQRGARPLARIRGYAMGGDPAGLTQLRPDGVPLARIAQIACDRAGVNPTGLAAIQAHGTGTPANDPVEINAIRRLCGHAAAEIPVVSFKGALGHSLGAAGAVELALAVLAIEHQTLPPNATLIEPDEALGEVCLPTIARELAPGAILKTSMGFGGHIAAVVLDSP